MHRLAAFFGSQPTPAPANTADALLKPGDHVSLKSPEEEPDVTIKETLRRFQENVDEEGDLVVVETKDFPCGTLSKQLVRLQRLSTGQPVMFPDGPLVSTYFLVRISSEA
ncbi:MAG: hypothetical protein RL150_167 [Candidatus Parcubacteria bacterium]|jgi:hypothetical protein